MVFETSSNKDFLIDQGTTEGSEALLREVYLPPFRASVEEGVQSVLIGLNSWGDEMIDPEDFKVDDILKKEWGFEGELVDTINRKVHEFLFMLRGLDNQKLSANEYLISDVLKGELGFEGFAVSDWYGVYEIPGGDYKAAVRAINAGIDMVMLPFDYKDFVANVTKAVQKGQIEKSRIDDAVRRILRAKFVGGLFDGGSLEPLEVLGSEEHKALARKAVAQSAVLLKNEANILPLQDTITHIRIAGSVADNVGRQSGGWTIEWQGVNGNIVLGGTSILQGITKRVQEGTVVEYDELGNFESAELADVGIAVVGEAPYAEGWGDRAFPILSAEDLQTIERLKSSSKKVVVIIISGRPLLITGELSKWNALVAAWLPGSEGSGIADVLFGDVPFTGTLPLPWPAYSEQLPIAPDGTTADGTHVLFPRGYKLP
jgi:beta-glucosidase